MGPMSAKKAVQISETGTKLLEETGDNCIIPAEESLIYPPGK